MTTTADVTAAVEEALDLPPGAQMVAGLGRAADLADTARGPEAEDLRLRTRQLLLGALHALGGVADVPLDQVHQLYAELQQRLDADGWSDNAWLQQRTMLALDTEPAEQARQWLARWRASDRDDLSDCAACEVQDLAYALARLGNHRGALEIARPVLTGSLVCDSQPARLMSLAADWHAHLGDAQAARELHLVSWRAVRGVPELALEQGAHLGLLIRSGNLARAVDVLVPVLERLAAQGSALATEASPRDRAPLLAVVSGILARGGEEGLAGAVAGQPAATLAGRLAAEARQVAAALDARNATTVVSDEVEAQLAPTPYPVGVDLVDVTVGRPGRRAVAPATSAPGHVVAPAGGRAGAGAPSGVPTGPAPTGLAAAVPAPAAPGPSGLPVPAAGGPVTSSIPVPVHPTSGMPTLTPAGSTAARPAPRGDDDVLALAAAVRDAIESFDTGTGTLVQRWLDRRDEVRPGSREEWAARSYLDRVASVDSPDPRWLLADALHAAEQAEDPVLAARAHVATTVLDLRDGRLSAWEDAVAHVRDLEARGAWAEAASAWSGLEDAARDPYSAAQAARGAAGCFERAGDVEWQAMALAHLARALTFVDPEEAGEVLAQAEAVLPDDASPVPRAELLGVQALRRRAQGDPEGAADALAAQITLLEGIHPLAGVNDRAARCQLLAETGLDGLEDESRELLRLGAGAGEAVVQALGQRFLGLALAQQGRLAEAAETLAAALPVLVGVAHPEVDGTQVLLGQLLAELGDLDGARDAYVGAADRLRAEFGDEGLRVQALLGAGEVEVVLDPTAAVRHLDEAARLAQDLPDPRGLVGALQLRADALAAAGDLAGGLAALAELPRRAEAVVAQASRGEGAPADVLDAHQLRIALLKQEVSMLHDAGRAEEALGSAQRLVELTSGQTRGQSWEPRFLLAQVQVAAGWIDDGEAGLRWLLRDLAGTEPAPLVASALADLLDRRGRPDEAAQVWAEHGTR